jgi:hypothetical protein
VSVPGRIGAAIELVESREAAVSAETATMFLFFLNIAILRLFLKE